MKKLANVGFLWIYVVSLTPLGVLAAGIEETFFEEMPIVVTASKKAEKVNEAPGILTVITAEDIRRFGGNRLIDVLDRAPSLYTTGSHFLPDNVVSVRGDLLTQTDNHVLYMINSRPVKESWAGGWNYPFLNSFPLEMVDRIEIIRGPGSVLYGTNAYTGVINVITKSGSQGTEAGFLAGGGSFGTKRVRAGAGGEVGAFKAYAAYQTNSSAGWPFEATVEGPPARPKQQNDYSSRYTGTAVHGSYKGLAVDLFLSNAAPTSVGTNNRWPQGLIPTDRHFANIGYTHYFTDRWSAVLNNTYNYNMMYFDQDFGGFGKKYTEDLLSEVTISGALAEDAHVIFGGSGNFQSAPFRPKGPAGDSAYAASKSIHQTWWNAYAQADYKPMTMLKLVAGAQWNKPESLASDIVPRFGAILNFNNGWGAKLLHGQAFRAPYGQEAFIRVPGQILGNPDLIPEKIATTDVSVFYLEPKYQTTLTGFQSKEKNLIARTATPPFPQRFFNAGTLTSRGVELEFKVFPASWLSVLGSYTYQENKTGHGNLFGSGVKNTTHMPNQMAKIGATTVHPASGLTVGVFDSFFGRRSDVNIVKASRAKVNRSAFAYHWVTAHVRWDVFKMGLMVDFYGENLLDAEVFDAEFDRRAVNTNPARPGAGYSVMAGYKF